VTLVTSQVITRRLPPVSDGFCPLDLSDVFYAMRSDLARVEDRLREEANVDYPMVGEIVDKLIDAGGKRLRPLLLLLAAKPFQYDIEELIPAAAGVELLHNASLIHDDTVDHADVRRGQPTLNSLLPAETVILLGDYLFARSAMLAAATMNPRVVGVFASTLAKICDGQLSEVFTAHQVQQSIDDYKHRIYGKTASLFAGSAEMGAIIGKAPGDQIEAMRDFGGNIGMAFQIIDDVLDLRETTDAIGKPAGLDLRQGTVTLPTMLFFERNTHNGHYADLIRRVIDGNEATDSDYDEAVRVIRDSGALEASIDIAEEYVEHARAIIKNLPPGEPADMLEAFAMESLSRTH
jgi:geranylgeranyl pyrophosphate synthase